MIEVASNGEDIVRLRTVGDGKGMGGVVNRDCSANSAQDAELLAELNDTFRLTTGA